MGYVCPHAVGDRDGLQADERRRAARQRAEIAGDGIPVVGTVPWLRFAETKLKPAGNVSVTVTLLALLGPRLVTFKVNVIRPFTFVKSGVADWPMARSAAATLPEQQMALEVVMLSRQPEVIFPVSLFASSCTYKDQVPFGSSPLNRERLSQRELPVPAPENRPVAVPTKLVGL